MFQSTHPAKGATDFFVVVFLYDGVSIHTPAKGCDSYRLRKYRNHRRFNPRTHKGMTYPSKNLK